MKLQLDANQQYQVDAVAAVADPFQGQPQGAPEYSVIWLGGWDGLFAGQALKIAKERGKFTIFTLADALTRMAGQQNKAGDRNEANTRGSIIMQRVTNLPVGTPDSPEKSRSSENR